MTTIRDQEGREGVRVVKNTGPDAPNRTQTVQHIVEIEGRDDVFCYTTEEPVETETPPSPETVQTETVSPQPGKQPSFFRKVRNYTLLTTAITLAVCSWQFGIAGAVIGLPAGIAGGAAGYLAYRTAKLFNGNHKGIFNYAGIASLLLGAGATCAVTHITYKYLDNAVKKSYMPVLNHGGAEAGGKAHECNIAALYGRQQNQRQL